MKLKLKIFPKVFIVTFITIIITVVSFFFIFKFFMSSFLDEYHNKSFKEALIKVEELIENEDISEKNLLNIENNYKVSFSVLKNNRIYYPTYMNIKVDEDMELEAADAEVHIFNIDTGEDYHNKKHYNVSIGNDNYEIDVFYIVQVDEKNLSDIFYKILPYIIIIGFFIALGISYAYAKYNTKKIKHLNKLMKDMESFEYVPLEKLVEGDELAELENQVDHLYKKLIEEMNIIKKLEKDREVFMRGSIHELKTPVMTISLLLDEILEDKQLSDLNKDRLLDIYNRLKGVNKLVNEILNLSNLDSIKKDSSVKLETVLNELIEIYSYMIEDKSISLNNEVNSENIYMDNHDIKKVLSNLISNSIKYAPNNSVIDITFKNNLFEISNSMIGSISESKDLSLPFIVGNERKEEGNHGLGLYIVSTILNKYNYTYSYTYDNNKFTFKINFNRKKL